jgi:hypothetical protein
MICTFISIYGVPKVICEANYTYVATKGVCGANDTYATIPSNFYAPVLADLPHLSTPIHFYLFIPTLSYLVNTSPD